MGCTGSGDGDGVTGGDRNGSTPGAAGGTDASTARSQRFAGLVVLTVVVALVAAVLVTRDADEPPAVAAGSPTPSPPAGHAQDGHGDDPHGAAGLAEVAVPPAVDPESLPLRSERTVTLQPQLVDGVKVFDLTAEAVRWQWLDGVWVTAWGYNGQVPGPEFWVDEGDRVRINFRNELPVPTTIHWHGIDVPIEMDGVPHISQEPVAPGETFVYEFDAVPAGTFWYHSHFDSARQLDMGLSGAFVVRGRDEPDYDVDVVQLLDEWIRLPDGRNGWEGVAHAGHNPGEYNWFTINGKPFPATEEIVVSDGDLVRIRVVNVGYQAHPMHQHGKRFTVVAKDGAPLPEPYQADTVLVGAGERYDYEFVADRPGSWMFHCHILHHVGNDAVEPGGLMTFVSTTGYAGANERHMAGEHS